MESGDPEKAKAALAHLPPDQLAALLEHIHQGDSAP
jgi:hypothetical protein